MKITITIEEHISQDFEVEADTIEEAMEIAAQKYYDCEFVINSADVTAKLMMADDGENCTEWEEF